MHFDGCAECRAELRELTAVAQALSSVPVENVTGAAVEPSDALGAACSTGSRTNGTRCGRGANRRVLASVGAFAAAAAAVIALVLVVGNGSSSPDARPCIPGVDGASVQATLLAKPVGTEIHVKVEGLRPGKYYWMWLTGDDEHRVGAGTFRGSSDPVDVRFTAAIPLAEAKRIWVTDSKDRVVLDARGFPLSPGGAATALRWFTSRRRAAHENLRG